MISDITKPTRPEQALLESEAKFRTLFNVAAIPLCHVQNDGVILDLNTKFTQTFGYTVTDIPTLDQWWQLAYPDPEYRKWVLDTWEAAVQESEAGGTDIQPIEYQVTCKNGEVRRVIISGTTLHDHFLATFVDVTDMKKTERALQATLADLERSNTELQQFAYVASHDLQEPLRAMVGFLQLLQSRYGGRLDDKGHHYIERAVAAGHRMQQLTSGLLTLSRVNTQGRSFEWTDLNTVLKGALDNLQSAIEETNAQINCETLPNMVVDGDQIRSLLQNLISNAIKYNESHEPVIDIGCQKRDEAILFFVKDNGIGISLDYHQKIFQVFQRLHSNVEYPGTGLGLALCKKIVERHGGTIRLESEPGKGAVFLFSLPWKRKGDPPGKV